MNRSLMSLTSLWATLVFILCLESGLSWRLEVHLTAVGLVEIDMQIADLWFTPLLGASRILRRLNALDRMAEEVLGVLFVVKMISFARVNPVLLLLWDVGPRDAGVSQLSEHLWQLEEAWRSSRQNCDVSFWLAHYVVPRFSTRISGACS